jgi:hypothetical protein
VVGGARPGYDEEAERRGAAAGRSRQGRGGGWSKEGARQGERAKGVRRQVTVGPTSDAARRGKGQKILGMHHASALRSFCRTE